MHCITNFETNYARLETALGILASLVAKDTVFLPFYERIEGELKLLQDSASALDRARQRAARQSAMR
jgi:hypothetical protein